MKILLKVAAVVCSAVLLVLLLKKKNPEFAFLLSLLAAVLILMGMIEPLKEVSAFFQEVQTITQMDELLIGPLFKCTAIAMLTRFSADLCKDNAQAALAGAVELAGTVTAFCVGMPLLIGMLRTIGGMI